MTTPEVAVERVFDRTAVIVLFPGQLDGSQAVGDGVALARQSGRTMTVVSVAQTSHPGLFVVNAGPMCVYNFERLRLEILNEAELRCRAAVAGIPDDISVRSQILTGSAKRVVRRIVEGREYAHLVLHDYWRAKRWTRSLAS